MMNLYVGAVEGYDLPVHPLLHPTKKTQSQVKAFGHGRKIIQRPVSAASVHLGSLIG